MLASQFDFTHYRGRHCCCCRGRRFLRRILRCACACERAITVLRLIFISNLELKQLPQIFHLQFVCILYSVSLFIRSFSLWCVVVCFFLCGSAIEISQLIFEFNCIKCFGCVRPLSIKLIWMSAMASDWIACRLVGGVVTSLTFK